MNPSERKDNLGTPWIFSIRNTHAPIASNSTVTKRLTHVCSPLLKLCISDEIMTTKSSTVGHDYIQRFEAGCTGAG